MLEDEQSGGIRLLNCAHGYFLESNERDDAVHAKKYTTVLSSAHKILRFLTEESLWMIKESCNGSNSFSFCGVRSGRYLTCSDNGDLTALISEDDENSNRKNSSNQTNVTTWNVEYLTGELCFISSPSCKNRKLSCHPLDGKLKMSHNWQGWEVWRFIEAGDGHVRIMSWHDNHILCSDQDGKVWTTNNLQGDWEKWEVDLGPDGANGVCIKSVSHGRYLQLGAGNRLITCDNVNASTSIWHLTAVNQQNFYVNSLAHDKRVSCGRHRIFSAGTRWGWEVWNVKFCEKGYVCLHSEAHGKYLSSDQNGNLYQTSDVDEKNTQWELRMSAMNSILLKSKTSGYFLSCDGDNFSTRSISIPGNNEVFCLEAALPSTKTGSQLRNTTGTFGLAIFIVTPVMVTIGVTGLGVLGSLGMLEASGALGVLASLSSSAMASGCYFSFLARSIFFSSIAIATALTKFDLDSEDHSCRDSTAGKVDAQIDVNRPFCDWQSW